MVSFLLGFIPSLVAWVYSKILEYKRSSSHSEVHSDNNLVELGNEAAKEVDRAVLLEGELSKSALQKFSSSLIKSNLIRFVTMDESFLLENRATLRAIAELGAILVYFYICDRTDLPEIQPRFVATPILLFQGCYIQILVLLGVGLEFHFIQAL